ncbi:hypothetical protein ACHAWT_003306 [Skeletonema menzelii]
MKAQLFATAALVLLNAIPCALSAEAQLVDTSHDVKKKRSLRLRGSSSAIEEIHHSTVPTTTVLATILSL